MKNIFTFITAAFFLFYFNFAGFLWLAGYDSIYQFFA